jgi:hypothetical protein
METWKAQTHIVLPVFGLRHHQRARLEDGCLHWTSEGGSHLPAAIVVRGAAVLKSFQELSGNKTAQEAGPEVERLASEYGPLSLGSRRLRETHLWRREIGCLPDHLQELSLEGGGQRIEPVACWWVLGRFFAFIAAVAVELSHVTQAQNLQRPIPSPMDVGMDVKDWQDVVQTLRSIRHELGGATSNTSPAVRRSDLEVSGFATLLRQILKRIVSLGGVRPSLGPNEARLPIQRHFSLTFEVGGLFGLLAAQLWMAIGNGEAIYACANCGTMFRFNPKTSDGGRRNRPRPGDPTYCDGCFPKKIRAAHQLRTHRQLKAAQLRSELQLDGAVISVTREPGRILDWTSEF